MKLAHVLAIARAEIRLTRRLVRYWVFLALSYAIGGLVYLQYAAIHAFFSSYSATAASIGPRYLVGAMGLYYMIVFMVGLVFLGFDLRSRDSRERMVEVLDSRPFTNLEAVVGRFFGLLIPAWVPVVVLVLLFEAVGYLLPALGSPIGEPIEPVSLFAFTVFMAIPAFSFSLALVFLVTLLVKNRLVAAVVTLAVLVGLSWGALRLPLYYGPFFDITGGYVVNFPSEILPGIADGVGWLQRLAVLLAAFGMLGMAAAVHPRLDGGSRKRSFAGAGALLVVAVVLMGAGYQMRKGMLDHLEYWREIHAARADDPGPDIIAINGSVRMDPGKEALDLHITLRAPGDDGLETALFTLNPGLEVVEASQTSGAAIPFTHEDGLLELEMPLHPSAETAVHLVIRGRPNTIFAYLDAAKTPEALIAWEGQIFLLGFERGLYRKSYVALMPGIRWLPTSGSDVSRDDPRVRPRDFFDLDLEVQVPDGWLVAGPGKRLEEGGGGSFRFSPPAPLSEVALIASDFVSFATEIEGVWMEVLVSPKHTRNFSELSDAAEEVKTWVREHLQEAAEVGLTYPYDGFTLVEIPTILRGYGGGWRLDTAMAPPAMVMMRESGFPTARFDVPFRDPEDFADRDGGLPRAKRDRLEAFCINDFSGGSIFVGAARSFFAHQTAAAGPTGMALNYVLEELTTITLTGARGYFSAHMFTPEVNQALGRILQTYFTGPRGRNFADAVIETFTSRPEVWNAVMDASLSDFDPTENPQRTVDVLALKGGALAQSIVDELGSDLTGALLSQLRNTHPGQNFDLADVVTASAQVDEDLGQLFSDWLTTTKLPAFVGESAETFRLDDADDGGPRYQLEATVRNDETTQGLFRFSYRVGVGDEVETVKSDPIRLTGHSALRWGTVVSRPPQGIWVEPYLSLNRDPFRIPMADLNEEKMVHEEPFEGIEEAEWMLPELDWIAVDDLDESFAIVEGDAKSGVRLGAKAADSETDQGLPLQEFGAPPADWSRATSATSWGRYRHTIAYVRPGKGNTRAVFSTTLPRAGSWDLEIHLPHKQRFRRARDWGVWNLEVENQGDTQTADFDTSAAPRGWNLVGSFELADGEVSLALLDTTTGQIVIADAIRWLPTAGNGAPMAIATVEE